MESPVNKPLEVNALLPNPAVLPYTLVTLLAVIVSAFWVMLATTPVGWVKI